MKLSTRKLYRKSNENVFGDIYFLNTQNGVCEALDYSNLNQEYKSSNIGIYWLVHYYQHIRLNHAGIIKQTNLLYSTVLQQQQENTYCRDIADLSDVSSEPTLINQSFAFCSAAGNISQLSGNRTLQQSCQAKS